jgi:hypothetical protein
MSEWAFMLIVSFPPLLIIGGGLYLTLRSTRISVQHLCRSCGYDLRGLPTGQICPECGAQLDGTNTIVPGQVITRRWRWMLGAVMIFVGGIWLVLSMVAMVLFMSLDV